MKNPKIRVYQHDLPKDVQIKNFVSIDTEAMGLQYTRDRLCLVQLCSEDGICHLVQIHKDIQPAPNLIKILTDPKILKIFHYARFDVGLLYYTFKAMCAPIYCTKIASRLCRTYSDRHGLKELCKALLKIELQKQEQSSDWGATILNEAQHSYAAKDVIYLRDLKTKLDEILLREKRQDLFAQCCDFLPTRVRLDVEGWNDIDIFAHH